jgi:hypothetical protein
MDDNKEIFVVKFPLNTEIWQQHILDRRFEYCREIYNSMVSKIKRILHYYQNFNEWKEIEQTSDFKQKNKLVQSFIKKYKLPFSEYGLGSFSAKFASRYKKYGINSTILEYISGNLWRSLEKYLYSKGNRIAYKENDTFNSYKTRLKAGSFNGIKYDLTKSTLTININGKQGKNGKYMTIPFVINPKSEYEMMCFSPSNEIREIIIQREFIRGKWKYYVSFSIKGKKPTKNRILGKGQVGIDLGPSSVAIASNKKVYIDELGKGVTNIENELYKISRKMDRSRRQNNPLQFNEDGTIRRYPKGERPKWVNSNNYNKLKNTRKELYRKKSALLKLSHINLANEVLNYGDNFIVENNPIDSWAKKAKETTVNKKGKFNKKKRFGKSIQNHAPSMFIEILKNKVNSLGGVLTKIDIKNAASQFDFTNGEKTKHKLNVRKITLSNGKTHLRDTLAAFNLQHFKGSNYDTEEMKQNYTNFCKLEKKEIERHKGRKNLKSFGI